MKVKTFVRRTPNDLDEALNSFIAGKKVIDIKVCECAVDTPGRGYGFDAWVTALVLYDLEER